MEEAKYKPEIGEKVSAISKHQTKGSVECYYLGSIDLGEKEGVWHLCSYFIDNGMYEKGLKLTHKPQMYREIQPIPEPVEEMTLADVCEELGSPIKIV